MKKLALLIFLSTFVCNVAYAGCELKADTLNNNFAIGPFVDPTTGDAETGLTVADGDILWKQPDSTTMAEEVGFTDCTHRAAGMYTCPYDATVVDVEGMAQYVVDVAGALTVFGNCLVLDAGYFDLKYGATALITSDLLGVLVDTTVTTVTSTTVLDLASTNPTNNDGIPAGATIYIRGGTEFCVERVTDWVGSTNSVTYSTVCPNLTVQAGDLVRIYANTAASLGKLLLDHTIIVGTNGVEIDDDEINITTVDSTWQTAMAAETNIGRIVASCSPDCQADSGTATSFVDAALTEADANYWAKDVGVVFTSGTIAGQVFCVSSFVPATDTINFTPAATQAVSTNTYTLIAAPGCDPFR